MGPAGKETIPLLIEGLGDPAPTVRLSAAEALWAVNGQSQKIMPVLLDLWQDSETSRLRERILALFASMGPDAKAALPQLLEARKSKLWSKRNSVGYVIKKIDPEVAAQVGIP
jgi:HEAT repeat protein